MSCLRSKDIEIMERFLRDELPEGELESFETHILDCGECAEELEKVAALSSELARRRDEIESGPTHQSSSQWAWLALAAVVLLAVGLMSVIRPWSVSDLAALAQVEPPVYQEAQLRGAGGGADERFKAGMELYVETDYRGAMRELEAAAELDGDRIDVQFFLGACRLLNGKDREGIEALTTVIEEGDTPFLEEALFMRAQGYLRADDADAAVGDLRAIAELEGDWESRAQDQLEQLEAWSKAQG